MNYTIPVIDLPEHILKMAPTRQKVIKSLVLEAIQRKLTPQPLPAVVSRLSVSFTPDENALLQHALGSFLSGPRLGEYCLAAIRHRQTTVTESTPPAAMFGPDQQTFYEQLREGLMSRKITLSEGATGIGKTRAFIKVGLDLIEAGKGPVVIAVPTINGIWQGLKDLEALRDQIQTEATAGFMLGRGNFFDPDVVRDLLADASANISEASAKQVSHWLQAGAPSSKSDALGTTEISLAYLLDDLIRIAPEFESFPSVALSRGEENEAERIYQTLRKTCEEADLLFVTHCMLACDLRKYRLSDNIAGFLGDYTHVMIDEAHLFESMVAMMESAEFSPVTLRAAVRKCTIGSQANRDAVIAQCSKLMVLADLSDEDYFSIRPWAKEDALAEKAIVGAFFSELENLKGRIEKLLGKKAITVENGGYRAQYLRDAKSVLYNILAGKKTVHIQISAVRRWPSFSVTPPTLKPLFNSLWDRVEAVGMISATLFLPGGVRAGHIIRSLHIPPERVFAPPAVIPAWVFDPVTLHIPQTPKDFVPPQEKDYKESTSEDFDTDTVVWTRRISEVCLQVAERAQKGTLILATSYETVGAIAAMMEGVGGRLLVQKRGGSFANLKAQFLEEEKQGRRPIWLGVGQAWTGLDLGDALSDEVICKLPFSPRGIRKNSGRGEGKFDAAFTFRQGIGRLVRRQGVTGKNLWILDGRIWSSPRPEFYAVFREILERYRKVEVKTADLVRAVQ